MSFLVPEFPISGDTPKTTDTIVLSCFKFEKKIIFFFEKQLFLLEFLDPISFSHSFHNFFFPTGSSASAGRQLHYRFGESLKKNLFFFGVFRSQNFQPCVP